MAALEGASELPRGARRVLERVFWGVDRMPARGARVVTLSPALVLAVPARQEA